MNFNKIFIQFTFLLLLSTQLLGQNTIKWSKYDIVFDSPSPLQKVEETNNFIDFDNENLAVTIEVIPIEETKLHQNNSIRVYTENLAKEMNFLNVVAGESLNQIPKGYFVEAEEKDIDNSQFPVFLAIFPIDEFDIVLKVMVYCYHKNRQDGLQILRSFRTQ